MIIPTTHFALLRECDTPQALRQSGSGAGDRGAMRAHDCGTEKGGNVVTPSSLRFLQIVHNAHLYADCNGPGRIRYLGYANQYLVPELTGLTTNFCFDAQLEDNFRRRASPRRWVRSESPCHGCERQYPTGS